MNRYETFIIFESDLAEEERKAILDRAESRISGNNGTILAYDDWGSRKLAYPIRKKSQGYYVRVDYCDTGNAVGTVEQLLRQDSRILRFMTVRTQENVDPEALQAESTVPESEHVPDENVEKEVESTAADGETAAAGEAETETVEKE